VRPCAQQLTERGDDLVDQWQRALPIHGRTVLEDLDRDEPAPVAWILKDVEVVDARNLPALPDQLGEHRPCPRQLFGPHRNLNPVDDHALVSTVEGWFIVLLCQRHGCGRACPPPSPWFGVGGGQVSRGRPDRVAVGIEVRSGRGEDLAGEVFA
jgi:hypothetical protein